MCVFDGKRDGNEELEMPGKYKGNEETRTKQMDSRERESSSGLEVRAVQGLQGTR